MRTSLVNWRGTAGKGIPLFVWNMWALFVIKINGAKNMLLCSLIFSVLSEFIHYILCIVSYESSDIIHIIYTHCATAIFIIVNEFANCNDTSNATLFCVLRSFPISIPLSSEIIGFVTITILCTCMFVCVSVNGKKGELNDIKVMPLHHKWISFNPRLLLTRLFFYMVVNYGF